MKPDINESYESWAERVRVFEYNAAVHGIEHGEAIDLVIERMSRKIMEKLLHPLYKSINSRKVVYDQARSKSEYQEHYIDRVKPAVDCINNKTT